MEPILRPCSAQNSMRSGSRAMVPSSLRISQITAAGSRPGERREIAARLGVAGAHQHAARLRHQRKDVAGLDDVVGLRVRRDGRLHGARAILRRDAGGDAGGRLDGNGERRAHAANGCRAPSAAG